MSQKRPLSSSHLKVVARCVVVLPCVGFVRVYSHKKSQARKQSVRIADRALVQVMS